jgi:hypothetical protein
MRPLAVAALLLVGVVGCGRNDSQSSVPQGASSGVRTAVAPTPEPPESRVSNDAVRSEPFTVDGLTFHFVLGPAVVHDGATQRTMVLHVKNEGTTTRRIYMPAEPVRAEVSELRFRTDAGSFYEPLATMHGYAAQEADFHEVPAHGVQSFPQTFTLEPPGAKGSPPARRRGFEPGRSVRVSWRYANSVLQWRGGASTTAGLSKPLFGGAPVAGLWVGEVRTEATWQL